MLKTADRRAAFDILLDTKPGLPDEWQQFHRRRGGHGFGDRSTRDPDGDNPGGVTHMKILPAYIAGAAAIALLASAPTASAEPLAGRWDASITIDGTDIPFRLDLSADGPGFHGTLFNGDETQTTTFASHVDGDVVLRARPLPDQHHRRASRTVQLVGKVQMRNDKDVTGSPFRAVRYVAPADNCRRTCRTSPASGRSRTRPTRARRRGASSSSSPAPICRRRSSASTVTRAR